jgi:D-ribose pyranase
VLDVLVAIRPNYVIAQAWMADEFLRENSEAVRGRFAAGLIGVPITYEPHLALKQRVPGAIGLIRTGDSIQYANVVLQSG